MEGSGQLKKSTHQDAIPEDKFISVNYVLNLADNSSACLKVSIYVLVLFLLPSNS
jgi:hypothetical protein